MTAFTTTFITEAINYDKINGTFIWFTKKTKTTRFDVNQYINPQSFFSIIHVSTNKTFFSIETFKPLVKLSMYISIPKYLEF